jgi:hypothetical protein
LTRHDLWATIATLQSRGLVLAVMRTTFKRSSTVAGLLDGCGSVGVSTVGCGPAGPGSIPGHGPIEQYVAIDIRLPYLSLTKLHWVLMFGLRLESLIVRRINAKTEGIMISSPS